MAQDITSSIDQSLMVDGTTANVADVTTPLNNFITVINALLNGTQAIDRLLFEAAETLTIAAGVITAPTKLLVKVAAESGTTDDLVTITASNNRLAIFFADAGDTITFKHGSDNITLGGSDVAFTGNAFAIGCCIGGQWSLVTSIGGAPAAATYITQTASSGLSAEQALSSLSTGVMKVTTTTGVISTAVAGTDYQAPLKIAIIQDQKANNTDGGGSSATTWNTRTLNTEVYDPSALVTISSNKFTPIAGTYRLKAAAPGYKCGPNRLRLYNVTGAASVDQGVNAHSSTADATQTLAILETVFAPNGTDEYRIDHYTISAQATNGLGNAVNSGDVERYCTVSLEKIG
jgi:hypothetical protein